VGHDARAVLLAGTVVFSGSFYVLVLTGARWFGAITPFGGVALIVGWGMVGWRLIASRNADSGGP
jgi:uncharacterized membrane protein YgdD (TMEM256/DUF423 family)